MKLSKFSSLLLVLMGLNAALKAQAGEYPRVELIENNAAFFDGYLEDVQLRFYLEADGERNMYSNYLDLEGWYQNKDDTSKHWISGMLYDAGFVLYEGKAISDSFDQMRYHYNDRMYSGEYPGYALADALDSLELAADELKLQFIDGKYSALRGEDSLQFRMVFDEQKLFFRREFLLLNESRSLDLYELDLSARGYSVLAKSSNQILLHYQYVSNNWNPMGRCGAGYEIGLYLIEFEKHSAVYKSNKHYVLESCWSGAYWELERKGNGIELQSMEEGEANEFIDLSDFDANPDSIYSNIINRYF
ncbi:MAG: hypothetical protein NXI09_10820 [Bacteroidetes bacterium]|nr:hypothetical protein [Bacteroidota bacterium]